MIFTGRVHWGNFLFRLAWTSILMPGTVRDRARASRRLASIGTEQQAQLVQGLKVIFPAVANITDPGREVGNCDKFIS
jgi:hypothetical protein